MPIDDTADTLTLTETGTTHVKRGRHGKRVMQGAGFLSKCWEVERRLQKANDLEQASALENISEQTFYEAYRDLCIASREAVASLERATRLAAYRFGGDIGALLDMVHQASEGVKAHAKQSQHAALKRKWTSLVQSYDRHERNTKRYRSLIQKQAQADRTDAEAATA